MLYVGDVECELNPEEVHEVKYVTKDELRLLVQTERESFTPWFLAVCEHFLFKWWDVLEEKKVTRNSEIPEALEGLFDKETIHKMP